MRSGPNRRWLLCLVVVLVAGPMVAAGASDGPTIESVAYAGGGAVATPQEPPFLWQSASHAFDVALAAGNESGDYEVCLESRPPDANDSTRLGCGGATLEAGEQTTVVVEVDPWPANLTGEQEVTAVLARANGTDGQVVDRRTVPVNVLLRDADPDGDGLTNERETTTGTDLFVADTDGDGLDDGMEVDTYGTEPTKADTDGDGLADAAEVNEHQTDPTNADTDEDGLTDDLEVETHGTNPNRADTDGDGLDDAAEVNTYGTDPNRADTDDDGLGDAAEVNEYGTNPTKADTDEDGLADGPEANVHGTDPAKADTDGDGLNDAAEVEEYGTDPTEADTDGDGLDDGVEVETHGTNPTNADTDRDGLSDGEEVEAGTDPLTPDAGRADRTPLATSEVVFALVILAGVVLFALFAFYRRSIGGAVVERVRVLGGGAEAARSGEGATVSDGPSADALAAPIPTNRNRVLELLVENGGRMLQSDIVEATDWSKSKVSRVLSDMDEEGDIAKIDVGKGNLIALPEVAPPNAGSALDRGDE